MVHKDILAEATIRSKKYLALGDSYTIGEGVAGNERFPYLTASLLHRQQLNICDPDYIAATGWTTLDLQAAIAAREPLDAYDVVTLLIGVNDQYRRWDTEGYRIRFTQLIQKAIQLSSSQPSHVFVLSIPDYSVTPFVAGLDKARVRSEIAQLNTINKKIAEQNRVAYLELTSLTRKAANDPSLLVADGLHYSGKEYQLWAEKLAALMKPVLV